MIQHSTSGKVIGPVDVSLLCLQQRTHPAVLTSCLPPHALVTLVQRCSHAPPVSNKTLDGRACQLLQISPCSDWLGHIQHHLGSISGA